MGANPGYAIGQLARSLRTAAEHGDAATRERAQKKAETWAHVFGGMLAGTLDVGSRTPVADTPSWATPEVVKGGFATGALLAGGPLKPHEEALAETLGIARDGQERAALNAWYLSDAGIAALDAMLRAGTYRIDVPEEGALLAVAWLLAHGQGDAARTILDAIGPWMSRLRFYPQPAAQPLMPTALVHVQTVAQTISQLEELRDQDAVLAQREALTIWNPMLDRIVALFAETVEGPMPALVPRDGREPAGRDACWAIEGGWPCQRFPDGWRERAAACLADFRRLRAEHARCGKPKRAKENIARLRGYLEICAADPRALEGRDVGVIRMILAHIARKRGLPDSPRCRSLRETQARQAALPTRNELARVMLARLRGRPRYGGIDDLEPLLVPVAGDEAASIGFPSAAGHPMPARLERVARRALQATVEQLVEEGIIPSAEVLARVVPQLNAQIAAAGIADPALRRLHGAIYQAFRRRRSLLLLNLEHQVRIDELPWVAALAAFRVDDDETRALARATLTDLVTLTLDAFPQTILPNKLLQELRALAKRAGLALPIVDELAADIFMGELTNKYLDAAQHAARMLEGTLYEVYYDIPTARIRGMGGRQPILARLRAVVAGTSLQQRPHTSPELAALCCERAGNRPSWGSPAANGTIIEQEQILTTHNLAVLVDGLDLRDSLAPHVPVLARRCFDWILRGLQVPHGSFPSRLLVVKNAAYAFRQMIFYLSLAPSGALAEFVEWAWTRLAEQPAAFQSCFRPAVEGLARAAQGRSPEAAPAARRFLGWTTTRHWLLADHA